MLALSGLRECNIFDTAFRTAQTVRVNDVAWMDDLLIMSSCKDAGQVAGNLSRVAGCLVDRCLHMGMFPNLGSNKTEAIVGLKGKEAKLARKTFLAAKDPTLAIPSQMWPDERLRIVATYKHLGGIVHHTGKLDKEVRARAGYGWTAFARHKRTIFCQRHVGVPLSVPCFVHHVAWSRRMGRGQGDYLGSHQSGLHCHVSLHACQAFCWRHAGEDRILAHLGLPPLPVWVHFQRLSYLASFVNLGAKEMWAMAHCEKRWLASVRSSRDWLWRQIDGGKRHATWQLAWDEWKGIIKHSPKRWKRLIKFGQQCATRTFILHEGWQQCRGLLLRAS